MEERSPTTRGPRKLSLATLRRLPPTPPKGKSFHFPKDKIKRRRVTVGGGLITRGPWMGTKRIVFYDVAVSSFMPTGGAVYIINDVPNVEFAGNDARIGRQITMKRVYLSLLADYGNGGGQSRIIILYDRSPSNANPGINEVFDDAGVIHTGDLAFAVIAPYKYDNIGTKYEVLYDEQFAIGGEVEERWITRVDIELNHKATFGTIGNVPTTGALWLILFGNNNAQSSGRLACQMFFEDE